MQRVLSLIVLGVLTISAVGQAKQPPKGQSAAKSTQKKSPAPAKKGAAAVKKPQPSATPSRKTTAANAAPTPEPSPQLPDSEADKKRFEKAIAATTAAEKARLLRRFLDEFPASSYTGEGVEYLVTARAMAGSERLESGDVNEALASFRLAVDEAPTPIPDRLYNDVVLKTVLNLYQRGQQQPALEIAGRIEKKVAGNGKQLLGLAAFHLGTENGVEARRLAEAAIAADPAAPAGYQALGLAHRLNFELEASAAAYAKASDLDPDSLPAKRSLAEMNRALGRPDEAAAIYRSILVSNEGDTPARTGLVLALFESGKRIEAEKELASAVERDPRNFTLLAGAAYWYAANNQGAKAIEYAQKAIDAEPRYIWGHIALARGLMKENKPVEAERTLIKARQYGNFPTLDYEIASARFMAGLYREAVEELGKTFTIKDGVLHTKLGGRVASEGKTFQEAVGNERRASILAPAAADDVETSEKLRVLFEVSKKVEATSDEAELSALADEFVRGDDKMKLHRQLYIANVLLQKNVALAKVGELLKASLGNAEAGLDVAAPGAAVMATELYESRAVAFSRNEFLLIPDVPRPILSAILRGRIEELSGWTLYQQKNYPDAIVRLRRAISVFPDKSAWWRSGMWRLGAALEADGKDKEALDSYIQSYKTDRPSALRYGVIESLYVKMHGNREGLEDLIGANPQSAVSAMPLKTDQTLTATVAKPSREIKETPKTDTFIAERRAAPSSAELKGVPAVQDPPAKQPRKFDAKALLGETDKGQANIASKAEPETSKAGDVPKTETTEPEKRADTAAAKIAPVAAERQTEKVPIIVKSADAVTSSVQSEEKAAEKETVTVSLAELLSKRTPADHVETERHGEGGVSTELALKPLLQLLEPIRSIEAAVAPPPTADLKNAADEKEPDQKVISAEAAAEPSAKNANKTEPEPKKKDANDVTTGEPPEQPKTDPPKTDADPTTGQAAKKAEPDDVPRDPPAESAPKPPDKSFAKAEVIVSDPLKIAEKVPETKPESKSLFEPIVITVPQTWKQTGNPTDAIRVETEGSSRSQAKKGGSDPGSSGATRSRLVDGKEVKSDQQCSIELSDENISLLNGGGSMGILITILGEGTLKDVTASTNSPRDVEVRPEPEIEGLPGRRFYVVKSVSTRTGTFQVNFESPCGKKEITVRVK